MIFRNRWWGEGKAGKAAYKVRLRDFRQPTLVFWVLYGNAHLVTLTLVRLGLFFLVYFFNVDF